MKNPNEKKSFLDKNYEKMAKARIYELAKNNKEEVEAKEDIETEEKDINKTIQSLNEKDGSQINRVRNSIPKEYYSQLSDSPDNIHKIIMNVEEYLSKQNVPSVVTESAKKEIFEMQKKGKIDFASGKDLNDLFLNEVEKQSYLLNGKAAILAELEQELIDSKFPYEQTKEIKEEMSGMLDAILKNTGPDQDYNVILENMLVDLKSRVKHYSEKNLQDKIKKM